MRTAEQERAAFALAKVRTTANETYSNEYRSYVKSFPMMIKTNGLGPALAFARSKPSGAYPAIHQQLEAWYQGKFQDTRRLEDAVCNIDPQTLVAVTVEMLALLKWMRLFVDSYIERDGD